MNTKASIASTLALACALSVLASGAFAATSQTKDIVLDRIRNPVVVVAPTQGANPGAAPVVMQTTTFANGDAMVVTVMQEKSNGNMVARAVNGQFRTGDRFRVKMLASRDGKVALYNTKPTGELVREPLWRGDVSRGLEIMSPAMRLEGNKGTDQLHIVLEPAQETGVFAWITSWLKSPPTATSKDIRLDVQNTPSDTYLLGLEGRGLLTTLRIKHN
jgi:hypothetical protein